MRRLNRNLDSASFPPSFTGPNRLAWELELLQQQREIRRQPTEKHKFQASRWKQAKGQLIRETINKCAYCEVNFTTVAYGDVEHYRPKSIYWWLAYTYFNYAPSCQLCNQKFKKANFPIPSAALQAPLVRKNSSDSYLNRLAGFITPDPLDDTLGRPFAAFTADHTNERPLSIDPYLDDPLDYFAYDHDDNVKEVWIIPLNNTVSGIALSCIDLYGLNRKDLRTKRYQALFNYRAVREIVEITTPGSRPNRAARASLQLLLMDNAEFLGMYQHYETRPVDPVPDII
ncbi:MAG: hypothetical protein IPL46_30525 [Saprospiraceae bacterium]|nr:hypothetical protein [Saprospiraceae bacterium]